MSRSASEEVLIIGAGQAGLALAFELQQRAIPYRLIDAGTEPGHSWRHRWDSLQLFTPAKHSSLPGAPFPVPAWRYPTKDEVADYLAAYAAGHQIPIDHKTKALDLIRHDGRFNIRTTGGEILLTAQVVIATGPFGEPFIPSFATNLAAGISQYHSDDYRNPAELLPGPVLVVGGGNSGIQIAEEVAAAGHPTTVAHRQPLRPVPHRIAGRELFDWLTATRMIDAQADTLIGRRLRRTEPLIGTSRSRWRRLGLKFKPHVISTAGTTVLFADETTTQPTTIIWATGYRHDDTWIRLPRALDEHRTLITFGGLTPIEGLYTIGRSWQRDRGSALLGFVGRDARRVADSIGQRAKGHRS